jgi:hypothetical protein
MKKTVAGLLMLLTLGCVENQPGAFMSHAGPAGAPGGPMGGGGCGNGVCRASFSPNLMGAWGSPMLMPPGAGGPSLSPAEQAARNTLAMSLPPELVQQVAARGEDAMGGGILRAGGPVPPGGAPPGMTALPAPVPPLGSGLPGAVAAVGALAGAPQPYPAGRTSVRFTGPSGMKIAWFAPTADGKTQFTPNALQAPARYNFPQAAIYRLKLSDIPGRPGIELYPTLEVVPANAKTATFLAHSSVPLTFTQEDFEQVLAGNYLVKVIYLPYPQFQDLAVAAPGEISSARLEPGADPIKEALLRGSILLVVRMGNIDLEAPGTPAMDAPGPYQQPACPPPGFGMGPGMAGPGAMAGGAGRYPGLPPGPMVPYGMGNRGQMPPPGMPGMPGMQGMPGMPPGMPTNLPPRPPVPTGSAKKSSKTQPVDYKAEDGDKKKEPAKKRSSWLPWSSSDDKK